MSLHAVLHESTGLNPEINPLKSFLSFFMRIMCIYAIASLLSELASVTADFKVRLKNEGEKK